MCDSVVQLFLETAYLCRKYNYVTWVSCITSRAMSFMAMRARMVEEVSKSLLLLYKSGFADTHHASNMPDARIHLVNASRIKKCRRIDAFCDLISFKPGQHSHSLTLRLCLLEHRKCYASTTMCSVTLPHLLCCLLYTIQTTFNVPLQNAFGTIFIYIYFIGFQGFDSNWRVSRLGVNYKSMPELVIGTKVSVVVLDRHVSMYSNAYWTHNNKKMHTISRINIYRSTTLPCKRRRNSYLGPRSCFVNMGSHYR